MSSSSSDPRPVYASEQDLPTISHESVFVPTYDTLSQSAGECSNCNHPLPSTTTASSTASMSSTSNEAKFPSSISTDSLSDSSTKGGSSTTSNSGAETRKKNTSKPLIDTLLKKNAQWSNDVSSVDKYFFKTSALVQAPKVLWLGCCDSRVPETTLVAARPGDIFVHRNIANQFHPNDDSAQAALAFAVEEAKIQHVLVVGHTICGGCKGAWEAPPEAAFAKATPLARFLAPLIALRHGLPATEETDLQSLVEANVKQSVTAIANSDVVKNNWKLKGSAGVQVHGLVYHLETGRLHNLHITISPPEDDDEDWAAGDSSQRARRGSQIERERLEDARLSALLEELKIPEQKESEEAILAAKMLSEDPKSV